MKYNQILFSLLIIQKIFEITCVVNFKDYDSTKKALSTKTYNDLLGIPVECKNKGALKNFAIKKDASNVWFTFNCYSSLTEGNEYDESILKDLLSTFSQTFRYKTTDSIESLGRIDIRCPVDYALNKFEFTKDSNSYLVVDYSCVGVKSSSQTKANTVVSDSLEGSSNTLDAIAGLICGSSIIETEDVPGTPLKGFKFSFTSGSNGNVKGQYFYSYYQLRSIEIEKKQWAKNTADFRNRNTQKN